MAEREPARAGLEAGAASVGELFDWGASRHGETPAISVKADGRWQQHSHAELREIVHDLALGVVALGVAPGERVCILANTRPEWTYLAYATWLAGAVVVPIYPTNSPEECEWVAGNSEASVIVCENAEQLEKIRTVRGRLPSLRTLVLIDGEADDAVPLSRVGADASQEDELGRRTAAVSADDPLLII